jgi:hypothetical protein
VGAIEGAGLGIVLGGKVMVGTRLGLKVGETLGLSVELADTLQI